jgi:hypothetical protein
MLARSTLGPKGIVVIIIILISVVVHSVMTSIEPKGSTAGIRHRPDRRLGSLVVALGRRIILPRGSGVTVRRRSG